ncbi:MAG: hypothetical protein AABX14_04240 [Candidatus Aenigmatarchaeota archaeon]
MDRATITLYEGRSPRYGHFTPVHFTNLMEYTIGSGRLRERPPYVTGESRHGSTGIKQGWFTYFLKNGARVTYNLKPKSRHKARHTRIQVKGPANEAKRVQRILQNVMNTVRYNTAPIVPASPFYDGDLLF